MSVFRPECRTTRNGDAISDETALFLIKQSVANRRALIFGKLRDERGGTCAMGAFWDDNPKVTVHSALVDEVAAVNDSVPPSATPQERWKKVNSWLRFKIAALTKAKGR